MAHLLENLIASGGLLMVLVTMTGESAGIPISSEVVVPLGGYLASQGRLSLAWVVAAATVGNLIGSLIAFYLARRFGPWVVLGPGRRLGLHEGHLRLAERFFGRFGAAAVFVGRLLPVVRTYISFPAGLSDMGVVRFVLLTVAGSVPWNLGLAYAGFRLGRDWHQVDHLLGRLTVPIAVLVLALLAVAYLVGRRWLERERPAPAAAGPDRAS